MNKTKRERSFEEIGLFRFIFLNDLRRKKINLKINTYDLNSGLNLDQQKQKKNKSKSLGNQNWSGVGN